MSRPIQKNHRWGAIALAAVFALTLVQIYVNVLGGSVLAKPTRVTVDLNQSGGLFGNSAVTYRGVRVGAVESVDLADGHAVAHLVLHAGQQIPRDAKAVVRTLSPAGEQFIDLQPTRDGGPYLTDGARISAAATVTPTSVAETLEAVDKLMMQVDDEALRTILHETHDAFADPETLGRVLSASMDLIRVLDDVWPETVRLMRNSQTVLRTGVKTSDDFLDFAKSARSFADWLDDYNPELRKLIKESPGHVQVLQALADDLDASVPPLLRDYVKLTGVLASHDPHVRELLKQFPRGFAKLTSTFVGGRLRANMLISTNPVCGYGVTDTNPQLGKQFRQPVPADRECPRSFPLQQRGSAWRPGPTR